MDLPDNVYCLMADGFGACTKCVRYAIDIVCFHMTNIDTDERGNFTKEGIESLSPEHKQWSVLEVVSNQNDIRVCSFNFLHDIPYGPPFIPPCEDEVLIQYINTIVYDPTMRNK